MKGDQNNIECLAYPKINKRDRFFSDYLLKIEYSNAFATLYNDVKTMKSQKS